MPEQIARDMKRARVRGLTVVAVLAVVAAVAVADYAWTRHFSPSAHAADAARLFWDAVVAGDVESVEALLAPDAVQTAEELVELYDGYVYSGWADPRMTRDGSSSPYVQCVVNTGVRDRQGLTHGKLTVMTNRDRKWLVLGAGSGWSLSPDGAVEITRP